MFENTEADTIEAQIHRLRDGVGEICSAADDLSLEAFLGPLGNWTPRDIVAHLVGWNRAMVRGNRQLLEGEMPFYDVDPGEDWCNVNARFVADYPSENRTELLAEYERATAELAEFLRSLSPHQWKDGTGVLHGEEELTVRAAVDELIEDHHHHVEQLRDLAKGP